MQKSTSMEIITNKKKKRKKKTKNNRMRMRKTMQTHISKYAECNLFARICQIETRLNGTVFAKINETIRK